MWLSVKQFADLAELNPRTARKVCARCSARASAWRGAQLQVRNSAPTGGAESARYEVLLESLPASLQAAWAAGAQDHGEARALGVWSHVERETRHSAFAMLPEALQKEARRMAEAVTLFHGFDGSDAPMGERYAAAAAYAGKSKSAMRGWVQKCEGHHPGDWHVLLAPNPKGRPKQAPISPEAFEWVKEQWLRLSKPSLKPIYRRLLPIAKDHGWAVPSYETLKRRIEKEVPLSVRILMREGQDALDRLYPHMRRNYDMPLHSLWSGDGRKSDVFALFEDGTIGRPITMTWEELRSRVILACEVGKTENAHLVRRATYKAVSRSKAVPDEVLIDNGKAFASKEISGGSPTRYTFKVKEDEVMGLFAFLGTKVWWAMPRHGQSKPIESLHRAFAEMDKRFAGAYCGNRPDARPEDCDPRKAVPIATYRAVLQETIEAYNAQNHRGDGMEERSPLEVYDELIKHTVIRQPTTEQLRQLQESVEEVRLNKDSGAAKVNGNEYWSERWAELDRRVTYAARYDADDPERPVGLYRGGQFLGEGKLIRRTGFKDRDSARAHRAAKRDYERAVKDQAAAVVDMKRAARWPDPAAGRSNAELPTGKVVTPLRPRLESRAVARPKPAITRAEVLDVLLRRKSVD